MVYTFILVNVADLKLASPSLVSSAFSHVLAFSLRYLFRVTVFVTLQAALLLKDTILCRRFKTPPPLLGQLRLLPRPGLQSRVPRPRQHHRHAAGRPSA